MSVDLRFHRSLDRSTQLVFGRGPSPDDFVGHIVVVAVAPAPAVRMSVGAAYATAVAVLAPGAAIAIRAEYRSEVERPLVGVARDRAQVAQAYLSIQTERFQQAVSATHSTRARYQSAALRTAFAGAAFQDAAPAACGLAGVFQASAPMFADAAASWQDAASSHQVLASRFGEAQATSAHVGGRWQDTIRYLRAVTTAAQEAVARAMAIRQHAGPAQQILLRQAGRWQDAWGPRPGRTAVVVPPTPGRYIPPPGNAVDLLFDTLLTRSTHLIFGRDGSVVPAPILVPVLEAYYVFNTVTLARADSGVEIPARGLAVGISRDGPHWTWSAVIPGGARALVARNPDPVELIAVVNGLEMRLLAENSERDRRHGADWLRVSGRSRSAWLSEQYAPKEARSNLTALNAQQLADAVLTVNGVSIGWTLDWQIVDWLVPAGAWSHYGTCMEALARLAEAGGGYLQADPAAQRIAVLPHYPALPWHWPSATPDIVLPEDIVEVERTLTADQPEYNAVYVVGQNAAGRCDRVLRAGSAADRVAPQVVDALATDPIMTRARGSTVLASGGAQSRISLRLPVLPETGLILPGRMIEYSAEGVTRRGMTRSLQGEWSHPELWQTVEIEVRD